MVNGLPQFWRIIVCVFIGGIVVLPWYLTHTSTHQLVAFMCNIKKTKAIIRIQFVQNSALAGVSLMIPEGAIARGQTEEIYLAVSHELIDRPHTEHNQTLLSPVVLCGPPTVLLAKSVVLVLPHCAQMSKNDWRFSVIGSSTHPTDDKCWEVRMLSLAIIVFVLYNLDTIIKKISVFCGNSLVIYVEPQ